MTFGKTIPFAEELKKKLFIKREESLRKNVERAFGTSLLCHHPWSCSTHRKGVLGYDNQGMGIVHNVIVEDERDSYGHVFEHKHVEGSALEINADGSIIHAIQFILIE